MVKTKKYLSSVQKNRNKSIKRNKKSLRLNKKSLRRNRKSLRGGKSIRRNRKSLRQNKSMIRQLNKNTIQTGGGDKPLSFLLALDNNDYTKIKGIYFLWYGSKGLSIVLIESLNHEKHEAQIDTSQIDIDTIQWLKENKFVIIEKTKTTTKLITNIDNSDELNKMLPSTKMETLGSHNTKSEIFKDIQNAPVVPSYFLINTDLNIGDIPNSVIEQNRKSCEFFLKNELKVLDDVCHFLMYSELYKIKTDVVTSFCRKLGISKKRECIMKINYDIPKYSTDSDIKGKESIFSYYLKTGRLMSQLKVLSLNIMEGQGGAFRTRFFELIEVHNPDVICLQESKNLDIPNYTQIYFKGPTPNEGYIHRMLSLYIINDGPLEYTPDDTPKITTRLCPTIRDNFVTTLNYKNANNTPKEIKIGNVHLCGGRYDESDESVVNAGSDIDQIKTEVLKKMVAADADIILGDFNSDAQKEPKNIDFLIKNGFSREQATKWNTSPITYLQTQQYNKVNFGETATSFFNTQPDMIWYKQNLSNIESRTVGELPAPNNPLREKAGMSDHIGLLCTFNI